MMTGTRHAQVQQLRAFIDTKRRSIESAVKRYDVPAAVAELRELAAPLLNPDRFSSTWKVAQSVPTGCNNALELTTVQNLYLECFYRDVAAFLLRFVAIHMEICLSEQDRQQAFDVFFDCHVVSSSRVIAVLTATLSAFTTRTDTLDRTVEEDAEIAIIQCVRLLEKAIVAEGIQAVVTEMLVQEQVYNGLADCIPLVGSLLQLTQSRCISSAIGDGRRKGYDWSTGACYAAFVAARY